MINPGDTGHVQKHNDIDAHLAGLDTGKANISVGNQFDDAVRAQLAANLGNGSTVEGEAVADVAVTRAAAVNLRAASVLTQGLYSRSTPTPDSGSPIIPLGVDPNQSGVNGTGRLWALGTGSSMIGYTDDDGATFTPVAAIPSAAAGLTPCQITITSGVGGGDFLFVCFASSVANQGQVWRSVAPGATPALTLTQIFGMDATTNMINGPGGVAGHTGGGLNLRNSSFAIQVDGSYAYILPYAAGTANATPTTRTDGLMAAGSDILSLPITNAFYGSMHGMTITVAGAGAAGAALTTTIMRIFGSTKVQLDKVAQTSVSGATVTFSAISTAMDAFQGPPIMVCPNPCAVDPATITWSITHGWSMARHGHAVKVIDGVPWVNLGDFPYPNDAYGPPPSTHVGMWAATSAAGTSWNQKMGASATTPYDGINFFPITIGGEPMIIMESDSKGGAGPVILPTQSSAAGLVQQIPSARTQMPVVATMRCLSLTPDGNIMWLSTGESGGVGPVDAVMIAAPPFDTPIMLEQMAWGACGTVYDAIISHGFVWFGQCRIGIEKFVGQ